MDTDALIREHHGYVVSGKTDRAAQVAAILAERGVHVGEKPKKVAPVVEAAAVVVPETAATTKPRKRA